MSLCLSYNNPNALRANSRDASEPAMSYSSSSSKIFTVHIGVCAGALRIVYTFPYYSNSLDVPCMRSTFFTLAAHTRSSAVYEPTQIHINFQPLVVLDILGPPGYNDAREIAHGFAARSCQADIEFDCISIAYFAS